MKRKCSIPNFCCLIDPADIPGFQPGSKLIVPCAPCQVPADIDTCDQQALIDHVISLNEVK